MATTTPVLWTRQKKSGPSHTIYIRIEAGNRRQYVSTGVKIRRTDWNENKGVARKAGKHADKINGIVSDLVHLIEGIILDLQREGSPITPKTVKTRLNSTKLTSFDFLEFGQSYADQLFRENKISTGRRYASVFKKLAEFTDGPLPTEKLTSDFIRRYQTYLIEVQGNGTSTVASYMRAIRAVFHRAVNDGYMKEEQNPFKGITFKEPRSEKVWLSMDELDRLVNLELELDSANWHVRNYFLFATYCAGIRFTDICELRVKNIAGFEFNYRTSKTKTPIQFPLPQPAIQIANLYVNQSNSRESRLFPILNNYNTESAINLRRAISSQNAFSNKVLKRLAQEAGIQKSVSFHMARHTFANFALRNGWGVRQIQQVLGHSELKTTEAYLADFDPSFLGVKINELFNRKEAK